MVEKLQTENLLNNPMHYGEHIVGVLNPPDKLPVVELYSYQKTTQNYNKLQADIYEKQKTAKDFNKRKFPSVLKILGGIITACICVIFRKNILKTLKNFSKNIKGCL